MSNENRLLHLIDTIYSTIDASLPTHDLLSHLSTSLDFGLATEQHVMLPSGNSILVDAASADYAQDRERLRLRSLVEGYNRTFSEVNRLPSISIAKNMVRQGAILATEDFMSLREWRKDDYYNGFFRANGWEQHVALITSVNEHSIWSYSFTRNQKRPIDPSTLKLLHYLVPHLERAAQIRRALGQLTLHQQAGWEALNTASYGVIILSIDRHVLFANTVAEPAISKGSFFRIHNGHLETTDCTRYRSLEKEIEKAISAGLHHDEIYTGSAVTVADDSGRGQYHVLCQPLRLPDSYDQARRPACIVVICDPSSALSIPIDRLQDAFELTRTEARIAIEIATGKSLEECAEELDHSVATSRTVLKRVFAKTGTRRQNELTHLILSMNVRMPNFGHAE